MNSKTQKIVMAALVAALCCVATMVIKIPSPLNGYVNLGDCVVLLAGWLLSPQYAFLAAGVGSALADIFSGFVFYAPITFLIKGAMAVIVYYLFKLFKEKLGNTVAKIFGAVIAEITMVAGYFIFEGLLYGFIPAMVNIPANALQGLIGVFLGLLLVKILEKTRLF